MIEYRVSFNLNPGMYSPKEMSKVSAENDTEAAKIAKEYYEANPFGFPEATSACEPTEIIMTSYENDIFLGHVFDYVTLKKLNV